MKKNKTLKWESFYNFHLLFNKCFFLIWITTNIFFNKEKYNIIINFLDLIFLEKITLNMMIAHEEGYIKILEIDTSLKQILFNWWQNNVPSLKPSQCFVCHITIISTNHKIVRYTFTLPPTISMFIHKHIHHFSFRQQSCVGPIINV